MKNYKDFMEGYVASADKKPAADGRMVPARKIQMSRDDKTKDVAEKIDMKKADMGDVIKDFQDSDAPQFKGKSKEKRREMAIAAKLSAEELSAKQKKIDKNKNGKIDGADLAKLRGEEVEEGLQQTLRKVVPGYAKKQINKKMDAGKFGKTDVDKDANFYRYKKVMDKLKKEEIEMDEEMTPAQKAARLQLIKKVAANRANKERADSAAAQRRAMQDAKRSIRRDKDLRKPKVDPADKPDLVHKEDTHVVKYHDAQGNHKNDSKPMTQAKAQAHADNGNKIDKVGGKYTVHKINEGGPGSGPSKKSSGVTSQNIKQAIGIARDKRYKGGNYTGAHNTINKLRKGLADHPRVKDELRKQNESFLPEDNEMEKKEMMKTQLHFIKYAADEICEYIDMGGNIEEWYQNKVSKAFADFEGLHSYMEGTARKDGLKEELDSQESDVDYDRKPTFSEFISKLNK